MRKLFNFGFVALLAVLALGVASCNKDDDSFVPEFNTEFGSVFISGDTVYLPNHNTLNFTATITNNTELQGAWSVGDNSIIKYEDGKFTTLKEGTTTISYSYDGYKDETIVAVKDLFFSVGANKYAIDKAVDWWTIINYTYNLKKEMPLNKLRHDLFFMPKTMDIGNDGMEGSDNYIELSTVVEGQNAFSKLKEGVNPLAGFFGVNYYSLPTEDYSNIETENSSITVRNFGDVYEVRWAGKDQNGKDCTLYYLGKIKDVEYNI